MILHDPKSTYRVVPDERLSISYDLRIPTVTDRVKYRHAVRAAGGKQWSEIQMLAALEDGVKAILTEPADQNQRDELLEAIAGYRERITTFASEVRSGAVGAPEEDPIEFLKLVAEQMKPPALVKAIERVVIESYQPYAEMVADRETHAEIAGLVAARQLLIGWEGIEANFRRDRHGVPDDVLAYIPSLHLIVIGAEAERLMEPAAERLRPLRSRPGSASDQGHSNGTATPPENNP